MTAIWRTVRALFVRDMRIALSYKAGFALTTFGAVANIAGIFFLSRAFGGVAAPMLEQYGGSYFGFVIVGVAFTNFMALGIGGLGGRIREGQMMGTLEFMLLSPNRLVVLLLGSSAWSHAYATLTLAVYVVAGVLMGMDVGQANVPVALAAFALAIVSFNALGLLAASVVILIKQGDPVNWIVSSASILLAGVFYPVTVLPGALQALAQLLPMTHALEITRRAVFDGAGFVTLWPSFLALVVLTAILLPCGLLACRLAVRIAQQDGSLSYY
jgi:ABC-2 type transport system permease protein